MIEPTVVETEFRKATREFKYLMMPVLKKALDAAVRGETEHRISELRRIVKDPNSKEQFLRHWRLPA